MRKNTVKIIVAAIAASMCLSGCGSTAPEKTSSAVSETAPASVKESAAVNAENTVSGSASLIEDIDADKAKAILYGDDCAELAMLEIGENEDGRKLPFISLQAPVDFRLNAYYVTSSGNTKSICAPEDDKDSVIDQKEAIGNAEYIPEKLDVSYLSPVSVDSISVEVTKEPGRFDELLKSAESYDKDSVIFTDDTVYVDNGYGAFIYKKLPGDRVAEIIFAITDDRYKDGKNPYTKEDYFAAIDTLCKTVDLSSEEIEALPVYAQTNKKPVFDVIGNGETGVASLADLGSVWSEDVVKGTVCVDPMDGKSVTVGLIEEDTREDSKSQYSIDRPHFNQRVFIKYFSADGEDFDVEKSCEHEFLGPSYLSLLAESDDGKTKVYLDKDDIGPSLKRIDLLGTAELKEGGASYGNKYFYVENEFIFNSMADTDEWLKAEEVLGIKRSE